MIFHIKEIHAEVSAAFRLAEPVWIEHHPPAATDGRTETFELAVFLGFGGVSYKPLDRRTVETLVGRRL